MDLCRSRYSGDKNVAKYILRTIIITIRATEVAEDVNSALELYHPFRDLRRIIRGLFRHCKIGCPMGW